MAVAISTAKWNLIKQKKIVDVKFVILLTIKNGLITRYHKFTDYADIGGLACWPDEIHE